jgi:hypothetical protein
MPRESLECAEDLPKESRSQVALGQLEDEEVPGMPDQATQELYAWLSRLLTKSVSECRASIDDDQEKFDHRKVSQLRYTHVQSSDTNAPGLRSGQSLQQIQLALHAVLGARRRPDLT